MEQDPERQRFLKDELALVKDRIRTEWHMAQYFTRELGMSPLPNLDDLFGGGPADGPGGGGGGTGGFGVGLAAHQEPADLVNAGEFAGRSATKATRLLMEKVGRTRPLKLAEIYNAITKGGVRISSQQVLFKSLDRAKADFCRPGKRGEGLWALTDWYSPSELRRMRSKGSGDAEGETELEDDEKSSHDTAEHDESTERPEASGVVA